jgi:hypothetical protein
MRVKADSRLAKSLRIRVAGRLPQVFAIRSGSDFNPTMVKQLLPTSFRVTLAFGLLLSLTRLVCASDPSGAEETLDNFNTLHDPTVLSSSVGLGYNYADQHQDAFRGKLTLSGAYAFGAENRKDWVVSAELPFIHDEPGNSGASRASGVGDFKVGFGHVFDGTGRFRWGLGAAGTFDTASKRQFGDGAVTLSPIWGGGFRFTPTFELVGNVQYNVSLYEAAGRQPVHSLEISPALLKIWPHHWYSLAGWDSVLDFEDGKNHSGKVTAEIGKAFGVRQQWVLSTGVDVPVVRAGQDNFTVNAGINYVF